MISPTVTAVLDAPKEEVFAYLAEIENLPDWATDFAQELKYEDGKAKVVNGSVSSSSPSRPTPRAA